MIKIFKNKVFIGTLCLLIAAALTFLLLPRLYKAQASTMEVVRINKTVEYGTVITEGMLTVSEVGAYGLPDNVIKDKSEIVGLVANSTIYAGEYLWRGRFIPAEVYAETMAKGGLSEGTYLLTISFPTASAAIAGILRAGDTVDVYGYSEDEDDNISVNEVLTSVRVYKVFNSEMRSLDELDAELEEKHDVALTNYNFVPAYVVFIVNEEQSKALIGLEKTKSLHLTLREAGV